MMLACSRRRAHLRSLLTAAREKLAVEKERADSLVGEHFKLSQELRRALDQEAAVRRATAVKPSSAGAALASDHAASLPTLRRLEALHKIELPRPRLWRLASRTSWSLTASLISPSGFARSATRLELIPFGITRSATPCGGRLLSSAPRAAGRGSRPQRNSHTPGVSGHLCRMRFLLAAWNGTS